MLIVLRQFINLTLLVSSFMMLLILIKYPSDWLVSVSFCVFIIYLLSAIPLLVKFISESNRLYFGSFKSNVVLQVTVGNDSGLLVH